MTERQRRFAEFYAATGVAASAAIKAGYSPRSARSVGQRLLTNADIQHEIRRIQAELASERIADAQEIRERLTGILRDDLEKTGNRLRAADSLLKCGGNYLPQMPEPSDEPHDPAAAAETGGDGVQIVLPWNGQTWITSIQRSDGSIEPLLDPGGVTVFLTIEQQAAIERLYSVAIEEPGVEGRA